MLPLSLLMSVVGCVLCMMSVIYPWTMLKSTVNGNVYLGARLTSNFYLGKQCLVRFELPSMGYLTGEAVCTVGGGFLMQQCADQRDLAFCKDMIDDDVGRHVCALVGLLFPCASSNTTDVRTTLRQQTMAGWNMTQFTTSGLEALACSGRVDTMHLVLGSSIFAFLAFMSVSLLSVARICHTFTRAITVVSVIFIVTSVLAALVGMAGLIEYYSSVLQVNHAPAESGMWFFAGSVGVQMVGMIGGIVFVRRHVRSRRATSEKDASQQQASELTEMGAFQPLEEEGDA